MPILLEAELLPKDLECTSLAAHDLCRDFFLCLVQEFALVVNLDNVDHRGVTGLRVRVVSFALRQSPLVQPSLDLQTLEYRVVFEDFRLETGLKQLLITKAQL